MRNRLARTRAVPARLTPARATPVAVLAAAAVMVSGCATGQAPSEPAQPPASSESGQAPPASQQPGGGAKVEGVAWVNRLCGLVGGFTEAQRGGPAVDKSSPEAFKATSVARLEAAAREADRTLQGLRAMKPSPISGADGITDSFERGFVQVRDVLNSAKAKAEQVNTADRRAFLQGMKAVQQELRQGQAIKFSAGFEKFTRNKQLNAAAAKAPQCKAMTSAPPQPKQPPQAPR